MGDATSPPTGATTWPTELKLDKDKRVLTVSFDDGATFGLPAELLRVLSPSAEVQGHSPSQRVTVPGKKNVRIVQLEPVGTYAVRITFDAMNPAATPITINSRTDMA